MSELIARGRELRGRLSFASFLIASPIAGHDPVTMALNSAPTLAMKVVSRRPLSPLGTRERRRHRVFCTRFTEYHLRDDECVGVRDRESGEWMRGHAALRLHAVQVPPRGQDRTWIGRRLQFWGSRADVMTSPVVEVGRPERPSVTRYVSQVRSGEIFG